MPRKIWVPYLWDAFDKEKETDFEHSKWLHSSQTVYLNFHILLFIPASFILCNFVTYYCIYNVHYLVIICIW